MPGRAARAGNVRVGGIRARPRGRFRPGRSPARARLTENISGHLLNGVTEPVLVKAFEYWTNVDADLGKAVEQAVRSQQSDEAPTTGQSPAEPGSESAKKPE